MLCLRWLVTFILNFFSVLMLADLKLNNNYYATICYFQIHIVLNLQCVDCIDEHFFYPPIGRYFHWLVLWNQIISINIKPSNFRFCFTVDTAILFNTLHKVFIVLI